MKTLILKALRYLLGLAVLVALVCLADIRSVVTSLAYISLFDLFILIVLSFFLVLVSVIKWRIFLARLGIVATVTRLYRLYLVGYFVNLIMPSYLGGMWCVVSISGPMLTRCMRSRPPCLSVILDLLR